MELYAESLLKEKVESLLKDGRDFLESALQESGITEQDLVDFTIAENLYRSANCSSQEKVFH